MMFRSYHSAGSDLRLTDVTFEEHHLAISTVETRNIMAVIGFSCILEAQPVGKHTDECALSWIFLSPY